MGSCVFEGTLFRVLFAGKPKENTICRVQVPILTHPQVVFARAGGLARRYSTWRRPRLHQRGVRAGRSQAPLAGFRDAPKWLWLKKDVPNMAPRQMETKTQTCVSLALKILSHTATPKSDWDVTIFRWEGLGIGGGFTKFLATSRLTHFPMYSQFNRSH